MRRYQALIGITLVLALACAGCAATAQQQTDQRSDASTAWPLDSLSYIYSDPIAVSPLNDHPLRWVAFVLQPLGLAVDYMINRPAYSFAQSHPVLTGFTPEDATLHSQRPTGSYR